MCREWLVRFDDQHPEGLARLIERRDDLLMRPEIDSELPEQRRKLLAMGGNAWRIFLCHQLQFLVGVNHGSQVSGSNNGRKTSCETCR